MAIRLNPPATAFARIKRPRQMAPEHLRFIHGLPCLICGTPGEAAHVRYGSIPHGKRPTGAGERPSDRWTVPICPAHHREGPDAQHNHNEADWWRRHGIDPLIVAALLWAATGDMEAAYQICHAARHGFFGGRRC